MQHRRHRHHPVGDLGQQQVGQREVAEVVGADLAFEAVDGLRVRHGHDAGVVDQHVDPVDSVGEGAHRRQVLQVELADLDVAGHGRRRPRRPWSVLRTARIVLAPTRASSRAVTSPRPLLAPVTITVRPAKEGRSAAVHSTHGSQPRCARHVRSISAVAFAHRDVESRDDGLDVGRLFGGLLRVARHCELDEVALVAPAARRWG